MEIEAKYKIDSHEAMRARLRGIDARRTGAVREVNHIFDDAGRALLASDRGLRLRERFALDGPAVSALLTYKGRRVDAALKIREEIETPVGDPAAAFRILTALGFVEVVRFEKRRESWRLGDCEVDLDELPFLGTYLEIEGADESAVEQVARSLGLAESGRIRSSYVALVCAWCRMRGMPENRLAFE